MSKTIKEPATYEQQIEKLRQRGICMPDGCQSFLSQVNYYRLSGYILPFLNQDTDRCRIATTFSTIKGVYDFDTRLRSLTLLAIERVEIYIRTQLAYFHAHTYGALGYIDSANYNCKHDHISFMSHIQSSIDSNSKSPVVIHHMRVYDGKFPIWVIIDYFTVGMLSYFYADLKNHDKATIAKEMYGANYQMVESWMRCLTDLRNRCAHYSRLYYWVFSAVPFMNKSAFAPDRTLYTQLYMLKLMYPDRAEWNARFYEPLVKLIEEYKDAIQLKHIGFPDDWRDGLRW